MQVQGWCASNDLKIADTSAPCRTGYNIGKTVHGVPDAVDGRHASQSPPLRAIKLQWHRTSKWSCYFYAYLSQHFCSDVHKTASKQQKVGHGTDQRCRYD